MFVWIQGQFDYGSGKYRVEDGPKVSTVRRVNLTEE